MPAQVLGRLLRDLSTQEPNFFHFSCEIQLFSLYPVILLLEFLADLNVLDSCYSSVLKMLCLTLKKSKKIPNFDERFNSGQWNVKNEIWSKNLSRPQDFSGRFSQAVVHYHSKKIVLIESALVDVAEAMGVSLKISRILSSHDWEWMSRPQDSCRRDIHTLI